ncbi:MAG: universal stress protein [Flavobacteriales bacterium]|nr:universal stress protein [Flavobacteriales bacterium]
MKNILLPTDFSPNAKRAIRYAIFVFGERAKYTLLNTYEVPHAGAPMLISISDILAKESHKSLNNELEILESEFPELEGKITVISETGDPESVVKRLIDIANFDLVVMGTKGATGLKEALIGSVASNVMQNVEIPVLAVPESATLSVPQKILFAVDDITLNQGLFPSELAALTRKFDAELLVLNVVSKGELESVGNAKGNNRQPTSVFDGVKHSFHFAEGDNVNKAITEFAESKNIDLLAMVTRKNDFFSKLFGSSATKKMMQHVNMPIIAFH